MSMRSDNFNLISNFKANTTLNIAVVTSILLHVFILYIPMFHKYFNITFLNLMEITICFATFFISYFFIELKKLIYKLLWYDEG